MNKLDKTISKELLEIGERLGVNLDLKTL